MRKVLRIAFNIFLMILITFFITLSISTMSQSVEQIQRFFRISMFQEWKDYYNYVFKYPSLLYDIKAFVVSLFFVITLITLVCGMICRKTPAIKRIALYIQELSLKTKKIKKEKKKQKLKEQLNKLESDE